MVDTLKAEIEKLEAYLEELRAAHADFEHQLRRKKDARERGGAGPRKLGEEIAALERNLADNAKERERVQAELSALRERLARR